MSMGGGSFSETTNPSGTDFLSNAWFSVRGEITHDKPEWGSRRQSGHQRGSCGSGNETATARRGEESRAMLDLCVGRLDAVIEMQATLQHTVHACSTAPSQSVNPSKKDHQMQVSAIRAENEPWSGLCKCQLQGNSSAPT